MKSRIIVILLAVTMPLACYALGQAKFTAFHGIQGPAGLPNMDGAKFDCPGGELIGDLFTPTGPCTPGSRVHIRGVNFPYLVLTDDSRMTGLEEATTNCNFDGWVDGVGPGSGQMWGTIRLEVMEGSFPDWTPTGEVWEGTWTGSRTVTEGVTQSVSEFVAHGTGGSIEGLQAKWTVVLNPTTGEEKCEGRILAPGGK